MTSRVSSATGGWPQRAAVALAAALLALAVLHFELWRCPVAELLGVPCPGCGMTRAALLLLLSGDVAAAVRLQPLSPLLVPLAAIAGAIEGCRFVRFGPRPATATRARRRWLSVGLPVLAALLMGVWIARFFGAFGGPVPVVSHLRARAAETRSSPPSARFR